jgi:L-asparaginase II
VEPIVVEATRGNVVEARHRVHAAVVRDGALVLAAGEPQLLTYLRSSAKPLQALPLVRARPELGDEEVAIACASHLGRPEQLAAVRRLLSRAHADESELECGPEPTPIEHNCSGKHAGFLALCRANGWPTDGYRRPEHPCQQTMLAEIAAAAGVPPDSIATAADGCAVITFALPLERVAEAFGRLPALDGGARVVTAMRAHPDLLRGPVAADALVIRALDGWVAKGGAEGLFCACSPEGLGVALKVEDGSFRAILPALACVLGRLGIDAGGLGGISIENSRGDAVGVLRVSETPAG